MSEVARDERRPDETGNAAAQPHCPYVGLRSDPVLVFTQPIMEHRCHVAKRAQGISLDHQESFCLTSGYAACPRFVAPAARQPASRQADSARQRQLSVADLTPVEEMATGPRWLPAWASHVLVRFSPRDRILVGGLVALAVVVMGLNLMLKRTDARPTAADTSAALAAGGPSDAATRVALAQSLATATDAGLGSITTPTATPMPKPLPATPTLSAGQQLMLLNPAANGVGWVSSGERTSHFGERNLRAGVFDGQVYYGLFQFSLAPIPPGARITYASVELVGLSAEGLRPGGTWTLRLLPPELNSGWSTISYDAVRDASDGEVIRPALDSSDLGIRQTNVFTFSPVQRDILERSLGGRQIAFRLDGPSSGANNLFTWDTGYGGGFGARPVLRVIYEPPPTPTPFMITNTPVPLNIATVAALVAEATEQAATVGTRTPLPPNVITATPPIVVTNTATPGNAATAEWVAIEATARAELYGTPTPFPGPVWTTTPIPPTPVPPSPTPRPIIPTRVPPSPTPVPMLIPIEQIAATPTKAPSPTPSPTPSDLPADLKGKLAFISDRLGKEYIFIADPDGNVTALLTDGWAYSRAYQLESYSPDMVHKLFVRAGQAQVEHVIRGVSVTSSVSTDEIWVQNTADGWIWKLIGGPRVTYDPVWSPDGVHIAFVSQESGNDDIYVVDRNTGHETRLTNNGAIWDKHPSWSPDGRQIVFWSNRDTGRKSIWIMNADGSDPRPLIQDDSNNWDPVWIK